jgi:hypothetical protein
VSGGIAQHIAAIHDLADRALGQRREHQRGECKLDNVDAEHTHVHLTEGSGAPGQKAERNDDVDGACDGQCLQHRVSVACPL